MYRELKTAWNENKGKTKRMKAAVIGASEEALHTIKKAHEYGLTVMALDGNPDAAGLKAADEALVADISDENTVIEILKEKKPDFTLTAPIGRYLTTTGAVNDALGLPGISREMAVLCTDKFLFHQRLHAQNLRNCRCYAVDAGKITYAIKSELKEEPANCEEINIRFPAILKPRYGSGSRGIYMLTGMDDLKKALDMVFKEPYVLEECIDGREYGVDGAVTDSGFQMILLRSKENTPPPARQAVGYFSVLPSDDFRQQVQDYMEKVVACLGLKECLLHADLIRGEEGPFIIELSARPSGHNLHNLFTPLCTGIDMAGEYIKYRMGLSCCFAPESTRPMMIHYFDMQGKVKYVPGREKIKETVSARLVAWRCTIKKGEMLEPVSDGHSLMSRGYFVLEGENESVLRTQAELVKALFFCGT